jgi:TonB family protein
VIFPLDPLVAPASPPVPPRRARLLIDPQLHPYRPRVPREIIRPGARFWAIVQVCVSDTGAVTSAQVRKSGHPRLDAPIKAALMRWRYAPAEVDGRPVASCPDPFRYRIHVDFSGASASAE